MKVQSRVYLCPGLMSHNEKMSRQCYKRFQIVGLKRLFLKISVSIFASEYVGKGNSHFRSHCCLMNLKILLSIKLERISLQN